MKTDPNHKAPINPYSSYKIITFNIPFYKYPIMDSLTIFLPLLLLTTTFAWIGSGCSTHTANGKSSTVLLGGLYESREGAFEKQSHNSFPINGERESPSSRLTGNKVSILWGLVTYVDQ